MLLICRQALEDLAGRSYEIDDRDELLSLVDANTGPTQILGIQRDGQHSVLLLFAEIFRVHPQLWTLQIGR